MTETQRNILIGIFVGVVMVVVVLFGGETVTVMNRTNEDICKLNFAYAPGQDGWGRDWLLTSLRHSHSRDIHFPIFWGLGGEKTDGFSGRVVSCEGEVLAMVDGLGGESNYLIWEIK